MRLDSLQLLSRPDKWYVGQGDGLVWAPPYPAWADTPGYWDEAHLAQYPIGPLFAISFVTPTGEPLPARADARHWSPAALTLDYLLAPGLHAREVRSAPGGRVLATEWQVENRSRRDQSLDVVLWTAVEGAGVADDGVVPIAGGLRLRRTLRDRKQQSLLVDLSYRLSPVPHGAGACRAEAAGRTPDFRLTPFYDRWPERGALDDTVRLEGIGAEGQVYLGLRRRIRLRGGTGARFTASVAVDPVEVAAPARAAGASGAPSRQAVRHWRRFVAELPAWRSTDDHFQRYWWYRWYGLRLCRVPAGLGQYRHESTCEGIAYFHQPISYSAMCHLRELRWHAEPAWARGVAHTFLDRVDAAGVLPGRVYLDHLVEPDFYHADWGGALEDLEACHPGGGWLAQLEPALTRYAESLVRTRDPEGSGMIDVVDQYETGQEYMSRYEAVDPDADRYGWENRLRLKGIDVTVYAWRLFRLLATRATDPGARARWAAQAERTGRAIRQTMWDAGSGMFSDVNPASGRRTGVKAAVCFYPYLTELADASHLDGMEAHLFNPGEFWTPYPVPSSSVDDPRFDPDAQWKGKRHSCPWNGRVWPMTNSHLVDALARVVRLHRPAWAPRLVHLLRQFVRMLSFHGDAARPNSFEHYHPFSGRGSVYRGIDDYQHSWVNDLLVRHVAGVLPGGEAGFIVDPLPFGGRCSIEGVRLAGHRVAVRVTEGSYEVRVDGRRAGRGRVGQALEVRW